MTFLASDSSLKEKLGEPHWSQRPNTPSVSKRCYATSVIRQFYRLVNANCPQSTSLRAILKVTELERISNLGVWRTNRPGAMRRASEFLNVAVTQSYEQPHCQNNAPYALCHRRSQFPESSGPHTCCLRLALLLCSFCYLLLLHIW